MLSVNDYFMCLLYYDLFYLGLYHDEEESGLQKQIMIFFLNKKKSDLFDLNQIFFI